jgi:general secretion pathway protein D
MLAGSLTVVWGLSAGISSAAPLQGATPVLVGALCAGQAEPSGTRTEDKKGQGGDLLRRARQAMAENDLDAAEALVSQAEALGLSYGPLYTGDTPKKARRDLEQKRSAAKGPPPRPSQLFAPLSRSRHSKVPTTDPFARRGGNQPGEATTADASRDPQPADPPPPVDPSPAVPSLPPADLSEAAAPFGRAIPTMPPPDGNADGDLPPVLAQGSAEKPAASATSNSGGNPRDLLRSARRALAVGDVRRGTAFVVQARSQQASYGPLDDTPDKVEAAIRKYQEVTAQQSNSEAYRRAYARMLMEQASALFRSSDYDEAELLATQASRQQLSYGAFEAKPEEMLKRIAEVRRENAQAAAASAAAPPAANPPSAALPVAVPAAGAPAAEPPPQPTVSAAAQREAHELVRQAREALAAGQLSKAEEIARRVEKMRLPDAAFASENDHPGQILLDIQHAKVQQQGTAEPAGGSSAAPAASAKPMGPKQPEQPVSPAVYDPSRDPTRNVPAAEQQPLPLSGPRPADVAPDAPAAAKPETVPAPQGTPSAAGGPPGGARPKEGVARSLFRQGEEALKAHQADRAMQFFRQAALYMNELDPATAQRLKDHLQLLSAPGQNRPAGVPPKSLAEETASAQNILARQVFSEIARQESAAKALREKDPKGALSLLEETRQKVEAAGLEPAVREVMLRRVDRALSETRQFLEQNRPRIELEEKNNRIRQEVERQQRVKLENQQKVASMVDEFNRLVDEQRYAEAEVVAKRAAELDPKNAVVQQLLWQAKFVRRVMNNKDVEGQKEDLFWKAMANVDRSSMPFDDLNPYQHGDAKKWQELTKGRARLLAGRGRHRSERELEIERKLKTPVSVQFQNAALSKVIEYLGKIAEVNIHLDPQGLAQEAINSDTPVSIEVREIMLKSALNLILEPLHLSYVIKDEVLKVTSEQLRENQVSTVVYNVADLVVPIPNFVPGPGMGLEGAYRNAMGNAMVAYGGGGASLGAVGTPLAVVASKDGKRSSAAINPAVLAQLAGTHPQTGTIPGSTPLGLGPGGLGGGAQADFDSLIDLITSTIQPTTWDTVGGPGSIAPFETNLSIVVSQTQEVHEEIVDLLEQLRRMQDLQVTIEVRFITLNDDFLERIGVSFQFSIDSNVDAKQGPHFGEIVTAGVPPSTPPVRNLVRTDNDAQKRMTLGLNAAPDLRAGAPGFSPNLDLEFIQNSFGVVATPLLNPGEAASIGFAILSDIETYFFIEALQKDTRSNVLQAPKVTLFNGQQASVSDLSFSPFVMSVIPVVGDFAAAQQPVIVVLSEGTFMTVQAVVSNDRRFVRLTLVPLFSKILNDTRTFQFTGSETTTTDTSAEGWVNGSDPNSSRRNNNRNAQTTSRSGTTVQLPTYSTFSVTTTVSVPDGGTVLLGGIKRLSETRNEAGVPILNKVPYLNRLFKNTGIERTTTSLMMMVTPHIIIQEEEEEKLGVLPP